MHAPHHFDIALKVSGIGCTGCSMQVQNLLRGLGATDVRVDVAAGRATFEIEDRSTLGPILKLLESEGFKSRIDESEHHSHGSALLARLIPALILTVPLFFGHMLISGGPLHNPAVQFALALPVVLLGLYHFGGPAIASLRKMRPNMDVLVLLGSLSAFAYSVYGWLMNLGHQFMFFETAAMIVTMLMLGNFLEERASRRTASAIEDLARMQPPRAKRKKGDTVEEVESDSLVIGDILIVNSGDRIPIDGVVVSGVAQVDESIVTGESLPVERHNGARVVGGTLVTQGSLEIEVRAVGDETFIAEVVRLVREATATLPKLQRIGDAVSAVFVPMVMLCAAATMIIGMGVLDLTFQEALIRAVAVVVVACPCAMGIATPTAVMVGLGRSAKDGILFRTGEAIERLASTGQVLFDKTGTLTDGHFSLKKLLVHSGTEAEARGAIHALELRSSHPLAKALVHDTQQTAPLALSSITETVGRGLKGSAADGTQYELCGRHHLSADLAATLSDTSSNLILLKNNALMAELVVTDSPRSGAQNAVRELHALGYSTGIISGDTASRVESIGRELGIDVLLSQKTPDEKLQLVTQRDSENPAAYVGDGVNDAPALARARVGISLGDASTIAVKSSQVILLSGSIASLPRAVRLARATVRTIKQNLTWAFAYNVLMIPAAAMGYLSPLIAAMGMAFSDIVVIGNSLRLKNKKLD